MKNVIAILIGILGILSLMIIGGCEHEERELPRIAAREAASRALEFGRQGMPDAKVIGFYADVYYVPFENGLAENWYIKLGSPSTGLQSNLEVHGDGNVFIGSYVDYKHLYEKYSSYKRPTRDIPAGEVVPNEAWIEHEIMGGDYIRECCAKTPEFWLDSPEATEIASIHAKKCYSEQLDEDFSKVYIDDLSFYGDRWVVVFEPYEDESCIYHKVEVSLDPSGELIEVEVQIWERFN